MFLLRGFVLLLLQLLFDQSRMRFRLAVRVEGNALRKLFLPAWRQFARLHMGVGDGVRQLEAEQACRHALENRHFAVVVADVVLGLAPTVGCERAARQSQQYHDGDDDGDHTVASGARALRFALLDMLVADGFGDFRIVRIGGNAAVVLLYDGDFTGVGIGAVAVLLAYRGRLRHALFRRIVVLLGFLPLRSAAARAAGDFLPSRSAGADATGSLMMSAIGSRLALAAPPTNGV